MQIISNKAAETYEKYPNTAYPSNQSVLVDMLLNENRRSYIAFNIIGAPSTINNATLWIYSNQSLGSVTRTHEARRIIAAWLEATLTWNIPPNITDTNMSSQTVTASDGWYSFDVTNMLNDETTSEFGVQIRDSNEDTGSRLLKYYSSDDYYYINKRPILEINGYYVKIGGNDSLSGASWANAWATINKAATTVADGSTVHIGFGDYVLEPTANKIAPQNIGTSGIYYLPETATTGGGTGTVSVEQNA